MNAEFLFYPEIGNPMNHTGWLLSRTWRLFDVT